MLDPGASESSAVLEVKPALSVETRWNEMRGLDDHWFQQYQASRCARSILPSTSPLSLIVRSGGEKVLVGIQTLCFPRQIVRAHQRAWAQPVC